MSKIVKILVCVFIAFLAAGCQTPAGTWRAPADLQDHAYAAAQLWCDATEGVYCPIVDDPLGDDIQWASDADIDERAGVVACGLYSHNHDLMNPDRITRQTIRVAASTGVSRCTRAGIREVPFTRDETLIWVLAHELGHAAGLPDVRGEDGRGLLMGGDSTNLGPSEQDAANAVFALTHSNAGGYAPRHERVVQ